MSGEAAKLASRPWWRWEPGMRYQGESWGVEWGWVRVSERPAHIDALNARGPDSGVQLRGLEAPKKAPPRAGKQGQNA